MEIRSYFTSENALRAGIGLAIIALLGAIYYFGFRKSESAPSPEDPKPESAHQA